MSNKKVKQFRDLEFWAENGFVYVVHKKKAESINSKDVNEINKCFIGLEPDDFLKRAVIVGTYVYKYWEEYKSVAKEVYQFLNDAREVAKAAKETADKPLTKTQIFIPSTINNGKQLILPDSIKASKEIKPKKQENEPIIDIILHGFELC